MHINTNISTLIRCPKHWRPLARMPEFRQYNTPNNIIPRRHEFARPHPVPALDPQLVTLHLGIPERGDDREPGQRPAEDPAPGLLHQYGPEWGSQEAGPRAQEGSGCLGCLRIGGLAGTATRVVGSGVGNSDYKLRINAKEVPENAGPPSQEQARLAVPGACGPGGDGHPALPLNHK